MNLRDRYKYFGATLQALACNGIGIGVNLYIVLALPGMHWVNLAAIGLILALSVWVLIAGIRHKLLMDDSDRVLAMLHSGEMRWDDPEVTTVLQRLHGGVWPWRHKP